VAAALQIVAVGRLSPQLEPAFEHYRRLLAGLVALNVREVREVALQGRSPAEVLREEANRLLPLLEGARRVVALHAEGRAFTSPQLADWLQRSIEGGTTTFVIGGSLGLDDRVKGRADELLSLSPLTLPHQLARVVLAEQLFRALKIARRETYHH
jgi:23S rRNA (pseudouridine1915-N3)-methyltransferase